MRSKVGDHKRQTGFTLLEVVVALAIMGLGVVTVLEVFSAGLRLGSRSREKTEAIVQGQAVMDELLARPVMPEGAEEGTREDGRRWRVRVSPVRQEPLSDSTFNWELQEVTLEMRSPDGRRDRQVELKTLRLLRKKNS
jgi:general secretion pathway protein I